MAFACLAALLLLLLPSAVLTLSPEGWALLHFRSGIEDDPHYALATWNPYDENPCRWIGVRCMNGKVTSLKLAGLSLKGILSPELGQLTSLLELLLRENDFMGAIPFQFGGLEKLEVLDLAHNKLTGQLPHNLGNLSSLVRLFLENNNLEGVIPSELGKLKNLYELSVSMNKFRGTIPGGISDTLVAANYGSRSSSNLETGLCNLDCLQMVDFSGNYFEGDLPTCFHHFPRSSFYHNCLSSEGLQHQRTVQDCVTVSSSLFMRRLLEIDGSAGPSTPSGNITGSVWDLLSGPVTAPAPSSAPVVAPVSSAPASAPIVSPDSPVSSHSSALQQPSSSPNSRRTVILAAIASSVALSLIFMSIFVFLCYRHKGAAVRPWKSSMSGELQKGFTKGVPAISRVELEAACEDFSNIIGTSPDIVLFKGTLKNGTEIAVTSIRKSAKSWSSNSELIFWRKVENLSRMKHPNLVNLLGYCAEEQPFVRMLVFEYVSNGTVYEHLHNKESEHLDWATRMRVIMGVAYALEYMHYGLDTPITHTKVDAKSVYLMEDYSAKLADFGVWKASSLQRDSKSSSGGSNAIGHDDLELSDGLVPDADTNVSDFGVFLLEIVSGRRTHCKQRGSLSEWASNYLSNPGLIDYIVDPSLQGYNFEELKVICNLALQCLQIDISRTLTVKQISAILSSSLGSLNEPAVSKSSPLLWAELEILSQY